MLQSRALPLMIQGFSEEGTEASVLKSQHSKNMNPKSKDSKP